MKGVYWRPRYVSPAVLVLLALLSLGGYAVVEFFPLRHHYPYFREQLDASQLALQAMEVLKGERLKINPGIDSNTDPAQTGLIGPMITEVTSEPGDLGAKQTSLNPNFAALVVHYLKMAGVKQGETVAVGYTGSFPGINIAVLAAMQEMKLIPVIVSSATSSQWGATDPNFLWIDMERILNQRGVISFRSQAASLGGANDRGGGISRRGRDLLEKGVRRNGMRMLNPESLHEAIMLRMRIYHSQGAPIKAYINVGGGVVSVGQRRNAVRPGLTRHLLPQTGEDDSIALRFLSENTPVIHFENVERLASQHGLTVRPAVLPAAGDGGVYFRHRQSHWLAGGVLAVILISLYAFLRSDLGFRIMQTGGHQGDDYPPEPMV